MTEKHNDTNALRVSVMLGFLILTGCETETVSQKQVNARIELFKECMDLAAKMPRQADDDVSDVVDSCSSQAYYMTNHIQ